MPLRPALLAVLVALIWGANFVVIDIGLEGMPPTLFLALRFAVVLVPAIFFVPRPAAPLRDVLLLGVFMSIGQFGLLYTALALGMPAGIASLVLQAQVVLTVVFAALALRERPSAAQSVGVGVGAVGLLVVAVGRGGQTPLFALLVTVAAAASWAIGNVIARRLGRSGTAAQHPLAGLSVTVWSALVVPLPMLALSLVIDGPDAVGFALTHLTAPQLLSTAYTAGLASLVGYGIWNTLLARYAASAVVPFTMLVPPVGLATAWLVLGEIPSPAELAGGAVLLLGVALATGVIRPPRPRRAEARELSRSA
ncbi:O-acetylserine/cysteine efflux transporter [Microbacterium terrae]|uniref:Amino-acid metabolite efflux pump n=1 Tax=Microbacterium terrae TaxID=69369 RepID=A0A0M2H7X6_9MICO|nr:EamA family transporter [Microbacterium terrae]KJL40081.1 putative amino-acid metabolite efflux pump [Microbacterium terrae]MBP1079224.1 O-acetylserine/cysteine efflux transporter [Microbacterium terrae]GLJ98624.1 O-acetylserine/cysteine exporter [Microbacterium terrae]